MRFNITSAMIMTTICVTVVGSVLFLKTDTPELPGDLPPPQSTAAGLIGQAKAEPLEQAAPQEEVLHDAKNDQEMIKAILAMAPSQHPTQARFAKIPNSEIDVLVQCDEFDFGNNIACHKSYLAFTDWTGGAWNWNGWEMAQPAGGGHADYGGNEVYLAELKLNNKNHLRVDWSRPIDPQPLTDGKCGPPISGPVSSHTYASPVYVEANDEYWHSTTGGWPNRKGCNVPKGPGQGSYVHNRKEWRKVTERSDAVIDYPRACYHRNRNMIYVRTGGKTVFFELDASNNYALRVMNAGGSVSNSEYFDSAMDQKRDVCYIYKRAIGIIGTHFDPETGNRSKVFHSKSKIYRIQSLSVEHSTGDLVIIGTDGYGLVIDRDTGEEIDISAPVGIPAKSKIAGYLYGKFDMIEKLPCVGIGVADAREGVYLATLPANVCTMKTPATGSPLPHSDSDNASPAVSKVPISKVPIKQTKTVASPAAQPKPLALSQANYKSTVASATTLNSPAASVKEPESADNDFMTKCRQKGVVFCDPLSTHGPYAVNDGRLTQLENPDGSHGVPSETWWQVWRGVQEFQPGGLAGYDPAMDALKLTRTDQRSSSGLFTTNFSPDLKTQFGEGDTFYLQFQFRYNCDFVYLDCDPDSPGYKTDYRPFKRGQSSQGAKIAIIGEGDNQIGKSANACVRIQIVPHITTGMTFGAFHHCGKYAGINGYPGKVGGSTQVDHQPGGDFSCLRIPDSTKLEKANWKKGGTGPNCATMVSDEWMTLEMQVTIGEWQTQKSGEPKSNIKFWFSHEGKPLTKVIDKNLYLAEPDNRYFGYGKIWLQVHSTKADTNLGEPDRVAWYRHLIVSRAFIGS